MRFFHSLRGKLTLTYTLVTVLALLALEVLGGGLLLFFSSTYNSDQYEYFGDIIVTLAPQARDYLRPGEEDLPGLQAWLDRTYASGNASLEPQYLFDSPAAKIVKEDPMYVVGLDGTVLAQSPQDVNNLVGRQYSPPNLAGVPEAFDLAHSGDFLPVELSVAMPNGKYWMAVPITDPVIDQVITAEERTLFAIVVVTVEPSPPLILSLGPVILGALMATAALMLLGVIPFGAVFGYIISTGLTRRLAALTAAADAWSEGDFRPQPQDRSRDEIGILGMRLRRMAERIQNLLQSQHALAMMEERNRLARELHDTVKQQTFATLMQVRAARNLIGSEPAAAAQHLADAEALIKGAQKELSLIIAELRPAELDGQGLAGALQHYVDTWSQHSRIPATINIKNERSLPLPVEQALYRITQEALSNVARHSHASAVTISLDYLPDQIDLTVKDNGVGFDPQLTQTSGFGLQSMKERLDVLGGRLHLRSSAQTGTQIRATVPLVDAIAEKSEER